ncbi:MAG: VPLPA-CTERM sorting domain-containing protein [Pseudomonadales bacterium]
MNICQLASSNCRLLCLISCLSFSNFTSAAVVLGNLVGVASGNDSEAAILADFGLVVDELAKVDLPATSNDGLSIGSLVLNDDDEPISGDWAYAGPETVAYIVVKAGNQYALYDFTSAAMTNVGLWDTSDLGDKGLSHLTAYSSNVIPVPAAAWLFGSGLIGLAAARRKVT